MIVRFRHRGGGSSWCKVEKWEPFKTMTSPIHRSSPIGHLLYNMACDAATYARDWPGGDCSLVLTGGEWRRLKPLFKALGIEHGKGALTSTIFLGFGNFLVTSGIAPPPFDGYLMHELSESWHTDPTTLDLMYSCHTEPRDKADVCRASTNRSGGIDINIECGRWGIVSSVTIRAGFLNGRDPTGSNFFFLLIIAAYLTGLVKGLDKHIESHSTEWLYAYLAVLLYGHGAQRVAQRDAEWRSLMNEVRGVLDAAVRHIEASRLEEHQKSPCAAAARQVIEGVSLALGVVSLGQTEPSQLKEAMREWVLEKGSVETPLPATPEA